MKSSMIVVVRRREQAEEPAVPVDLGLDLSGEGVLRGGWRGQVLGGGPETEGLPRRDLIRQ